MNDEMEPQKGKYSVPIHQLDLFTKKSKQSQ